MPHARPTKAAPAIALSLALAAALALGLAAQQAGKLDRAPPPLAITLAQAPLTSDHLDIHVAATDAQPGLSALHLQLGALPPIPLHLGLNHVQLPPTSDALPDGPATLTVHASDAAWPPNRSTAQLPIQLDRTAPTLQLHSSSLTGAQGRVLALWLQSTEPVTAAATLAGKHVPFYPVGQHYRALLALPYDLAPGQHPLTLSATDPAGNRQSAALSVQVDETAFIKSGTIKLTKAQTEARKDDDANAAMRAERSAVYASQRPEALWQGPFIQPVQGVLTSTFGAYRTYSDGAKRTHEGTDLARRRGDPVRAPAPGIVALAKLQPIFGNAVLLDHGQGVITGYAHLDALSVQPGQHVNTGDLLGQLGSTGQSTGPHLHWTLVVAGSSADAMTWPSDGFSQPPDGPWQSAPSAPATAAQ